MKNTIQVREVVEPESGKIHRFYTYNRKPCKRVPIDTRLSRQLAGYALIEKDLRSVGVWLAEIDSLRASEIEIKGHILAKDREMYNVIKGLFVAALTFYGKCFTRCEGRPVKLERKQVEEKYRLKHDDLLNYRNNFAAHSGAKNLESVGIAVVIPRIKKGETYPQIYRELFQPDLFITKEGGIDFKDVVESMREVAIKKIELLSDKIMKEEVMPLGLDHWMKK